MVAEPSRDDKSVSHEYGRALEDYRSYLLLLARMHVGRDLRGRVDPSDIVQQTLLDAHRNRTQFRGEESDDLAAWLRQILANTIGMAVRTMFRAKRDVSREQQIRGQLHASSARLESLLMGDVSSPSCQAQRQERLIQLANALLQLPEANREALILRYCQGLSLQEISDQLERTPRAVAGLLQRGTRQLRELLQEPQSTWPGEE